MSRHTRRMDVLPPLPERLQRRSLALPALPRLTAWHGLALCLVIFLSGFAADAAGVGPRHVNVFAVLLRWTPLLLRGFGLNILISFLSMALGTVLGVFLGLALISPSLPWRGPAWGVTQFFRNAPWLVLLFFMIFLLPYHFRILGVAFTLPDWMKAVIGLGLPAMANVAEIVRGGVRSIPPGQWEAAESLGFTRRQQLWLIILPQAFRRMVPPWMNLYAILTTSTTLASIVGVNDVVTRAGQVLAAEGSRPGLLAPIYAYVLLMFFIYTYPVAWATRRLERNTQVRI
ncbi:MAG: polar amino acid ABC transporter permease [Rhodospirillales bacterium 20-64-7]|nr:MAG: polar amino acid ABC transporter permease [Rhodospirillales bacterium 20-64-7]